MPGAAGCTNPATHVVHVHAVDACNHPDLDSSGNMSDILCVGCVAAVAHQAHRQAVRFDRFLDPFCLTWISRSVRAAVPLLGEPLFR